jgi:hypothetical protein
MKQQRLAKLIGGIAESSPNVTPLIKTARALSLIYFAFHKSKN